MATSILGTFPILSFKKSQTDEYGFDYLSYQYTVKTSDLESYSIKKDDEFYGFSSLGSIISTKTLATGSTYVVESVDTKNTPGGLTELVVQTVGSKNTAENNTPRVSIISGGPLIFGLAGTLPSSAGTGEYGVAGAGQTVEVKFLASGGASGQQAVLTQYIGSLMPTAFRGISLPVPTRGPGPFGNQTTYETVDNVGNPVFSYAGIDGQYFGFRCRTILTERRGSLILVTLLFSEAGIKFTYGTGAQTTLIWNFPIFG
jgi:hypothetical protein